MAVLAFARNGAGAPLVLLHALGSSRHSWDPVVPALAAHFDVLAVDLPGFGASAPLPPDTEPSPAALAGAVAETLDAAGIGEAHVVGNSLGGWVALELAARRPVASLTLLAPAGLWRRHTPAYDRVSLRLSRSLARHAGALLSRVVRYRAGRVLVLGQTHGRPARMSVECARTAIRVLGSCPGFDATFAATLHRRFLATGTIDVPVTLAFGSRDLVLLPRQSRHVDQLPSEVRRETLPGCGHLPMSDDPAAVAAVICDTARRASSAARPA